MARIFDPRLMPTGSDPMAVQLAAQTMGRLQNRYDEAYNKQLEARAKTQLTVLAKFLSRGIDLAFLRDVWSDVAAIVNHQVAFSDYDWSKDSFSVSITFMS